MLGIVGRHYVIAWLIQALGRDLFADCLEP
jgi:hypothetical protein